VQNRSLQDQFCRVIENARDIIVLFDTGGNRLYTNPSGLAFFEGQYPRGKEADPFQHVHPEDRERVRTEYTKIASGGEPRRFELRAVTRDGKPWLMQVEATPVRDASGGGGGTFEAHSEKGKGTRIRVEVPRRTE
jgi:PAS domain S-box-containing protein